MTKAPQTARRRIQPRGWLALIVLIVVTCLPELAVTGADLELWGSPRWRSLSYQYGAFWVGLLQGWLPNYPGQAVAMFATHAFLHGGLLHLGPNMAVLWVLGRVLVRRMGPRRFLALYGISVVGGGAGFGLLGSSVQPMVGASGALFGLLGALKYADWRRRRARGASLLPLLRDIAGLAGLNLAMWWALSGLLAWETHLGGFVAGWAFAAALAGLAAARRPRRPPA
ncbi:rhomboid family intramembrane serine protease [Rhodobacter sp. Har01]|uniref:rhomboid family intramembrane serine protease n=1 Tax=Rhodobacter sp. Har01 TaxID=2883999 RepID=UPI001D08C066|nr:rhomboid family intramembrane serine protease [Rhodobacter sp. Har01]MCB6180112.1 rhomboid family intramembrane serine protease [Rhodobacter sp. Har01]